MGKARKIKAKPKHKSAPSISLEELARQQGVEPVWDLEALGELWPPEHDPDAFAEFIAAERAARRRIANS